MPAVDVEDAYKVEPAKSGRSSCKASKELIEKGELRFGSKVEMGGHATYHWRKLAYITAKQVQNVEEKMGGLESIGGYGELSAKQQLLLRKAFAKALSVGAKKDKDKAKAAAAKMKAKAARDKAKAAKAKAKAKALAAKAKVKAAKEAKKAKAATKAKGKTAKADAEVLENDADAAPPAKRARTPAEPDPKLTRLAHQALDLAKGGKWRDLFALLDKHPEVVNIRPVAREYAILHQAAWHGSQLAVDTLIDKYGADAALLTKSGKTAAAVAKGEGYVPLAKGMEER